MPTTTRTGKPNTAAAVDASIAKAPAFAQPILSYLRAVVHEAAPDVTEEIKWSRPFFLVNGTILCQMSAFTKHCGFGFWSPEMTAMLLADGIDAADASGSFGRIASMEDLPPRADLLRYVRHAAARARTGEAPSPVATRPRTSAKAPIAVPPEFTAALARSKPATIAFEGFPPGCRREYLDWITTAKRPETRDRRIAETILRLADGRRFNEEYSGKMAAK